MRSRGIAWSAAAVTLLYVLAVFTGAFLHHDFACHQNSRTHCQACQATQGAQRVERASAPPHVLNRVAGRVELQAPLLVEAPATSFVSDRAPPA